MDQSALVTLLVAVLSAAQPAPKPPVAPAAGETPRLLPAPPQISETLPPALAPPNFSGSPNRAGGEPRYLREPIIYCSDIRGERPNLTDISLVRPFRVVVASDQVMLRRLAEFMREHNCGVTIEGYSDERGTEAAKRRAAFQRAEAVRDYLVQLLPEAQRVRPDQFNVNGRGELRGSGLTPAQKQIARVIM